MYVKILILNRLEKLLNVIFYKFFYTKTLLNDNGFDWTDLSED